MMEVNDAMQGFRTFLDVMTGMAVFVFVVWGLLLYVKHSKKYGAMMQADAPVRPDPQHAQEALPNA